ncbi:MAG TPA: carboxypeptidase regulatory-like domain-containing protein, partial [Thermoanaerobaculia bacterium]|nr:carboxypeptidase regulatory-like domain-containing protein [Thermoanaerobaculia bacterium]
KMFVKNMTPRTTKEYVVGSSQQINAQWSARVYGRYRYSNHFWEDTNNTARSDYGCPGGDPNCDPKIPTQDYIPNLDAMRIQIGNGSRSAGGSSYVIAELDGAFTKYYEATAESEWRSASNKFFVRGSYTWSHYYGNFDQDNTAGAGNRDQNTYVGSSNFGDGPGRQVWDLKYGNLNGDRRHLLKAYGSYMLPWNASAGAYALYQSGQPWEAWNYELYNWSPDNDTSSGSRETIKFAERAGSHRSPAHYQLDLNYTQNIPVRGLNFQIIGQVFNLFNKQTGYDYQPSVHSADFGKPQYYWSPRRFQLAAAVQF